MTTTTQTKTNWRTLLPHFCDQHYRDVSESDRRFLLSRPWLITWRGEQWSAVTEGRIIVMAKGRHCDDEANERDRNRLLSVIDRDVPAGSAIDLAKLKGWCKEPHSLKKVECESCRGSGEDVCPHCERSGKCCDCDGTGKVIATRKKSPGWLRDKLVNRALLAHALRGCDSDEASLGVDKNSDMFVFAGQQRDGTEWRVVVMGLERESEDNAPRFEEWEA